MASSLRALLRQADALRDDARVPGALRAYERARRICKDTGDISGEAYCLQMIGVTRKIDDRPTEARRAYSQARERYETAGNLAGAGNVLRDIGISYLDQRKYQRALTAFRESTRVLAKADAGADLGITRVKAGLAHLGQRDFRKARSSIRRGLRLIRSAGSPFRELTALLDLARVDFAQKKYDDMLTHLWASYGVIRTERSFGKQERRRAQIEGLLAHGYLGLGQADRASHHLDESRTWLRHLSPRARKQVTRDINLDQLISRLTR